MCVCVWGGGGGGGAGEAINRETDREVQLERMKGRERET